MKITHVKFVVICSFWVVSCQQNKPENQQNSVDKTENVTADATPVFWTTICQDSGFSYFFDCNKEDCYQIELLNDPFKDFVVITLNLEDSLTDVIRFNRFAVSSSKSQTYGKKGMLNKVYPIINPMTKDTIFCFQKTENTIKVGKRQDLNYFFSTTIWQLPAKDKSPELDGESWRVKGRNQGKEVSIVRWNFSDTLYYSNIQKLLDLCKVKDYKYKKG